MTDPNSVNQVGQQLELDAEGHISGLAPPLPPVPDLSVAVDSGGPTPADPVGGA